MKSVKALLFVLVFSLTLLAGCTTTTTDIEAPAEDAGAATVHDVVTEDVEAMEDATEEDAGEVVDDAGEAMEEAAE